MKTEYTRELERLEVKLSAVDGEHTDIEPLLIYNTGTIEQKRQVIGSMFPEKLIFDGTSLRTTRVNEAAQFIYVINAELESQKKRTIESNFQLSAREVSSGFERLHTDAHRCPKLH